MTKAILATAAAVVLACGMTAPAWAQDSQGVCDKTVNGQVGTPNNNQDPLKGPGLGTGNNTAQNKVASTCETLVTPSGRQIPQNGPGVNDAGANGAQHSP